MQSVCGHVLGFCMPMMSNEETSPNVTCVEDNKVVMHINIKQEPHVEEEYQVSMLMILY
jgi:hypothetical protein